jgi:hypothetical protein
VEEMKRFWRHTVSGGATKKKDGRARIKGNTFIFVEC